MSPTLKSFVGWIVAGAGFFLGYAALSLVWHALHIPGPCGPLV